MATGRKVPFEENHFDWPKLWRTLAGNASDSTWANVPEIELPGTRQGLLRLRLHVVSMHTSAVTAKLRLFLKATSILSGYSATSITFDSVLAVPNDWLLMYSNDTFASGVIENLPAGTYRLAVTAAIHSSAESKILYGYSGGE